MRKWPIILSFALLIAAGTTSFAAGIITMEAPAVVSLDSGTVTITFYLEGFADLVAIYGFGVLFTDSESPNIQWSPAYPEIQPLWGEDTEVSGSNFMIIETVGWEGADVVERTLLGTIRYTIPPDTPPGDVSVVFRSDTEFYSFSNDDFSMVPYTSEPITFTYGDSPAEPCVLVGDVNGDGKVDILDMLLVRMHIGQPLSGGNEAYDVDGDGRISAFDLVLVRQNLRARCP